MARTRKELIIHRYPDRPCDMPHETWSGDYAVVKTLSAREVTVFINTHTPEYLRLFCNHTPVLQTFLENPENYHGIFIRVGRAITQHFQALQWEREVEE